LGWVGFWGDWVGIAGWVQGWGEGDGNLERLSPGPTAMAKSHGFIKLDILHGAWRMVWQKKYTESRTYFHKAAGATERLK